MNSTLQYFDDLRNQWMEDVLHLCSEIASQVSPAGSSLPAMSAYHFGTGGKRLRALIPLAVADALGEDPGRVLGFAAACEVLHNATLVHDDLQDGDETRRGAPTIWVKYGAPRAINLGDAMLYWTIAAATEHVQFDDSAKLRLVSRIVRATLRVIDGQEREFLLQDEADPSLEAYIRMVSGKTSGLFSLPMAGTAELCGAAESTVVALSSAAGHLGVLFQLQDDVLDLYGDKGRGQRGSDIGEGKISALVAHFFGHGASDDVEWLKQTLAAPRESVNESDVDRAATMFRDAGSLQWVVDEIERRRALALSSPDLASQPKLVVLLGGLADLFIAPIVGLH